MSVRKEYWFARRFPLTDRRKAMAPVHWKGWAAALIFIAALGVGGLGFLWMALSGHLVQGVVVFAIAAVVAAGWFITIAVAKGDPTRTVAEYRSSSGA